jgi:hypothetical protein
VVYFSAIFLKEHWWGWSTFQLTSGHFWVIVNKHLRTADLGDLKAARVKRSERIAKRLEEIARDLAVIEEELANLTANLKKIITDVVIKETEASMARILKRQADLLNERDEIMKSAEDEALRTLEEELADLEELWPHKPFELKKNILKLLAKRVIIEKQSTKFFQVTVEWKYKEWGIEQTYLIQEEGGRKEWTEEEIERLYEVYPGERNRFTIMQAFPDRSWRGIRHMADTLGLTAGKGQGRGKGIRFQRGLLESLYLSWNDICWLEANGLTLRSICENAGGWSSSSSRVWASYLWESLCL